MIDYFRHVFLSSDNVRLNYVYKIPRSTHFYFHRISGILRESKYHQSYSAVGFWHAPICIR